MAECWERGGGGGVVALPEEDGLGEDVAVEG